MNKKADKKGCKIKVIMLQ